MALAALRLPANVPGDFFVDSSCIDCDACRQIAPTIFHQNGDQSAVIRQPHAPEELLAAQKALIACPTASIGTLQRQDMRTALSAFPAKIAANVHSCGYTAESSFGAFSYLIVRERGNVMIDSPRFAGPLIKRIESMGGVADLLLTHRDDVADHAKYQQRFGARRVLHADDVTRDTAAVEWKPEGIESVRIDEEIVMIPVPGHTRGHSVFLYEDRFLFSGDHLAWDEKRARLYAFRHACWYSWSAQIESMERLLQYRFEWVLPGHGRPVQLPAEQMHEELVKCIAWMKKRR